MRDGTCARCGEVVHWGPPQCRRMVWVHRNPEDCVRYTEERVRRETEERMRQEQATAKV